MSISSVSALRSVVKTQLLYSRPASAAVKITLWEKSHTFAVRVEQGKFSALRPAVEAVLGCWFHAYFGHMGPPEFGKAVVAICELIRERHESRLPQPPDPRRLALSLS